MNAFFISLLLLIVPSLKAEDAPGASKNDSKSSLLDDRINLNFNWAGANAYNNHGGVSHSDSLSQGISAGLLYQDGRYQSLGSKTQSQANSYNSGYRPPSSWANTGSNSRGPYIQGNAGAGFAGGHGNAYAGSHSDKLAFQLGLGGPVLLSNLQPLNETQKAKGTGTAIKTVEIPVRKNAANELEFGSREDLKPKQNATK